MQPACPRLLTSTFARDLSGRACSYAIVRRENRQRSGGPWLRRRTLQPFSQPPSKSGLASPDTSLPAPESHRLCPSQLLPGSVTTVVTVIPQDFAHPLPTASMARPADHSTFQSWRIVNRTGSKSVERHRPSQYRSRSPKRWSTERPIDPDKPARQLAAAEILARG